MVAKINPPARSEPVVEPEVAPVVAPPPDITPEEAQRLIALHERLAKLEDHVASAPYNEQYKQELLALRQELGVA